MAQDACANKWDLTHIGKFNKREIKQPEIYFYTNLSRKVLLISFLKNIGIEEN